MKELDGKILVELQESMGSDASIANSAWTSTYDKDKREDKYDDKEKVEKLVRMLARSGHSTPFESVVFRFWIRMPIFTDRQHMTHRLQSSSGLSGRYRTLPSDFYELPDDVKGILEKTDNNSWIQYAYHNALQKSWDHYESSLDILKKACDDNNISNPEYKRCREVLRGVLGTSFMVERVSIFNLRSFANYMKLRKSEHAQAEIRCVAEQMYQCVKKAEVCPVALEELENKGWTV